MFEVDSALAAVEIRYPLAACHTVNDRFIEADPRDELERFEAASNVVPVSSTCVELPHRLGEQRTTCLLNLVD